MRKKKSRRKKSRRKKSVPTPSSATVWFNDEDGASFGYSPAAIREYFIGYFKASITAQGPSHDSAVKSWVDGQLARHVLLEADAAMKRFNQLAGPAFEDFVSQLKYDAAVSGLVDVGGTSMSPIVEKGKQGKLRRRLVDHGASQHGARLDHLCGEPGAPHGPRPLTARECLSLKLFEDLIGSGHTRKVAAFQVQKDSRVSQDFKKTTDPLQKIDRLRKRAGRLKT